MQLLFILFIALAFGDDTTITPGAEGEVHDPFHVVSEKVKGQARLCAPNWEPPLADDNNLWDNESRRAQRIVFRALKAEAQKSEEYKDYITSVLVKKFCELVYEKASMDQVFNIALFPSDHASCKNALKDHPEIMTTTQINFPADQFRLKMDVEDLRCAQEAIVDLKNKTVTVRTAVHSYYDKYKQWLKRKTPAT